MEYLMTYGWAILVAMVVGIVMWQLGVFDVGGHTTPGKSGFGAIIPLDWQGKKTDETISILLVNKGDTRQEMTKITSRLIAGGVAGNSCDDKEYNPDPLTIIPGDHEEITLQNCGITQPIGDYYRFEITIWYTNPASQIDHKSMGEIWGPID